jgi:CheY-like chemotaxis protein
MPQMTGEALARALRSLRPDIPIILGTGFTHTMDAKKARALGIDAFLIKPWTARELARTIAQVLAQRRALRI